MYIFVTSKGMLESEASNEDSAKADGEVSFKPLAKEIATTDSTDYKQMECYNCELFNYCRGYHAVSYETYGSFHKKDPQCWRVIK